MASQNRKTKNTTTRRYAPPINKKKKPDDEIEKPVSETEQGSEEQDQQIPSASAQSPQAQPQEKETSDERVLQGSTPYNPQETQSPALVTPGAETKPRAEASLSNLIDELFFGTAEKTVLESSYYADSMRRPYNPDDLYQKTNDYSIYEDMYLDDQISVCMQIKRDLVIGSGSDICIDMDDPVQQEIKKDLEKALFEDPKVPFDDQLEEIISAYRYGFSLSEKIFQHRPNGTLTLKEIKTRHPSTWLIHTDKHGNIEKFEQRGSSSSLDIDAKSLLHYVNNRAFQNPYGRSDLRAAYNAWFVKRQITRYYAIFLEKAASPTPVARYDANVQKQAVDDIYNAIKKFQTKTALAIPKAIELEFLEAKNTGEAYTKGINIFNMFIGRCLLIPDLLGFQGGETGGGSYSLGQDQIKVLFKHIERRRTTLERMINKEIILPLVVYNWGFMEHYPKFKFRPISDQHLVDLAKLWIEVVKGKIYTPNLEEINHFRKLAKFPEGDVMIPAPIAPPELGGADNAETEEKTGQEKPEDDPEGEKENPQDQDQEKGKAQDNQNQNVQNPAQNPAGQVQIQIQKPGGESQNESQGEDDEDKKKKVQTPSSNYSQTDGLSGSGDHADPTAALVTLKDFAFDLPKGNYHRKVDFKALGTQMDRFKERIVSESMPLIKRIFEDLFDQIEQKKIVRDQKPDRIDSIKIKYLKDLKLILKRNLREAYLDGKLGGQKELLKGNYRTPLPDDKFLDLLEEETFQYVGDWEYQVTRGARVAMIEAIRDGKPLSAVIDLLDDKGIADSLVSLERFSRTKITDVLNRGRLAFFNESGVVAAYQYSAILDDRTTPICQGLHGKIFKNGSEPVPPLHFSCRSLLIPITKFEDWEADATVGKSPIDQFIEDNKGDGFSKR